MVSIIVPVYNAEHTIARCIESIIGQEFIDWELLLIDDGSSDRSAFICDEYVSRDKRIFAIHQQNVGVSATRNRGIEESKGELLCFIDADDYIERDYLSKMVLEMKQRNPDIVIQGLCGYDNKGIKVLEESFDSTHIHVDEITSSLLYHMIRFRGPYCKLFKSSIIKNNSVLFPIDICYGEDGIFYYEYLIYCKSISLLSNQGYCYSVNVNGSLSSKNHNPVMLWEMYRREYALFTKLHSVFCGVPKYTEADWEKLSNIKTLFCSVLRFRIGLKRLYQLLSAIANNEDYAFESVHAFSFKDKFLKTVIMSFKSR